MQCPVPESTHCREEETEESEKPSEGPPRKLLFSGIGGHGELGPDICLS